ncbi:MAG: DUF3786 domain-containing protein [Thermodesulfobacteriota bacterium]
MFESETPDAYEKVYAGLVARLAAAPLAAHAADLGLAWQDGAALAPLLGRDFLVGPQGVRAVDGSPVPVTHRIVLAWYLLRQGRGEPAGRFVPYRELPGGADFARYLAQAVEGRLAQGFAGRLPALVKAAQALSGRVSAQAAHDVTLDFMALPKLPLRLKFYDADEEFPAEAKLFYDLTAPNILDLECLAALGWMLMQELERAGG